MANPQSKLTITSKGQITLRRSVLDHLGVAAGEKLVVDLLPGGRAEVRAAPRRSVEELVGVLAKDGQTPLTIDEINEIIAAGWAGEL